MIQELLSQIERSISPQRAFPMNAEIHAIERWFTFSGFQQSAAYVQSRLNAFGLDSVEVYQHPADGKTMFGNWKAPLAWDVEAAWVKIVEPETLRRVIADWSAIPCALSMWSAPTPPEGIEAELIQIEGGDKAQDYANLDVRSKACFKFPGK